MHTYIHAFRFIYTYTHICVVPLFFSRRLPPLWRNSGNSGTFFLGGVQQEPGGRGRCLDHVVGPILHHASWRVGLSVEQKVSMAHREPKENRFFRFVFRFGSFLAPLDQKDWLGNQRKGSTHFSFSSPLKHHLFVSPFFCGGGGGFLCYGKFREPHGSSASRKASKGVERFWGLLAENGKIARYLPQVATSWLSLGFYFYIFAYCGLVVENQN